MKTGSCSSLRRDRTSERTERGRPGMRASIASSELACDLSAGIGHFQLDRGDHLRFDEEYRGYRIRYRRKKGWIANIWEPSALSRLDLVPFASSDEGRETLAERVRAIIDQLIATRM